MKKLIITFAFIFICATALFAQSSMSVSSKNIIVSLGVEAGFPVGTVGISDLYSFAIGGSLQGEYLVSSDFGLTLKAGYLDYLGKGGIKSAGFVPVLAGFRYNFNPKVYASGQLGVSFSTGNNSTSVVGTGSFFSYAPGIGFQVSRHVDVLARYEAASKGGITIGNIGVRLAYSFN